MSSDPILDQLFAEPWRFEFPQAMRILLRNSAHGDTPLAETRRYDSANEPVRIGVHQSLGFPASDIQSLDPLPDSARPDQKAKMLVNFMGLTGSSGVLPLWYTEFLLDNTRKDPATAEFFDIFNHRMAMLFYFGWEKYRFPVVQERRPDHDFFRQMLLSLAGMGTEYLQRRHVISDEIFAKYAGLLAIQPRSASALETILSDDLKVPVEVCQFAGNWYQLDGESICRMGNRETESEQLGVGVVVSEEYWSQEFMVRLRIGPLDLSDYTDFVGRGSALGRVAEICRFFSRDEMVFEVQLVLKKDQVPGTRLLSEPHADEENGDKDGNGEMYSRLGWTTWARSVAESAEKFSAEFERDADDVIIRL